MKTHILAAGSAILIAGCVSAVAAPAFAETKSYDLPVFTSLDVSSGLEVEFTTGGAQSVIAANDNGAWDKLDVSVKNGELKLKRKSTTMSWRAPKEKFKITVSAATINGVETASGSSVRGSGVTGDEVVIDSSSGSDVHITDIDAGSLEIDASSGSTLNISGTCQSVTVDSGSGSSVRAADMVCLYATVDASSGSSVSITATQSVTAEASSGASVKVSGDPLNTDVEKSSGGSVKIRS